MAVSPDGSTVYVARASDGKYVVVARDASTGVVRWRARTSGPNGGQLSANAAALSPNGQLLFVTGAVEVDVDTRTTLTVAYNTSNGSVAWQADRSVGQGNAAIPRRIAVSPGGARVFVAGSQTGTHGSDDFWDFFTVGYDTATGGEAWTKIYDGPAHEGDTAEGLGVSPDGTRVYVTGTSAASLPDRDFATVAYAASDGTQEWVTRYTVGVDNFASDLVVNPNGGRIFVAGYGRDSLNVPHGYRILAYRAVDGVQTQSARYDDGRDDFAVDLAVSGNGGKLFATGIGGGDFLTVALSGSLLHQLWATLYDGGHGTDNAYGIAVAPDGAHVYVTGESERAFIACFGEVRATAYATVQYDAATGTQGWVSRYIGRKKDPDQPRQVDTSPDGSLVYVTGDSDTGCRSSDVATLAYQA
jgi:DNA-binding beta-propeller fold protein YncE